MCLYRAVAILPGRDGDLSESSEEHSWGEANKGHNGSLKKVQFSHQNIGGLSTLWNLLHEVHVHLVETRQTLISEHIIYMKLQCSVSST